MSFPEAWITDDFEQSSEGFWSTSTGVFVNQNQNQHERGSFQADLELVNAIEEAVSSVAAETERELSLNCQQIWESIEALAQRRLKCLTKQENRKKTQAWLSDPVDASVNVMTSEEHHIGRNKTSNLSIGQEESSTQIGVELHPDDYMSCLSRDGMYIPSPQGLGFLMARNDEHVFAQHFRGIHSDVFFKPEQTSLMQLELDACDQDINWGDMEARPAQPPDCTETETGNQAQIILTTNRQLSTASTKPLKKARLFSNMPSRTVKKPSKAKETRLKPSDVRDKMRSSYRVSNSRSGFETEILNGSVPKARQSQSRRGRPHERGESCTYCTLRRKMCVGGMICDACSRSDIYRPLCIRADFKQSRQMQRTLYSTRVIALLDNVIGRTPLHHTSPLVTIRMSNGFDAYLEVDLQAYIALDENMLTHTVFRGLEGGTTFPKVRSTPYALCEDLVLSEAKNQPTITKHVLMFALNHAGVGNVTLPGSEMIRLALRFWAIQSIFFQLPWTIAEGADSVGMSPLQIPGYWYGRTLLPRLVNQELDQAFESRMDDIERHVLENLQQAVFKRHRELWCSIFLTTFIMLHSLERDSWNMHAWEFETGRPGGPSWPLGSDRPPYKYLEQNRHIADLLSSHFRVVNKGQTPFTLDWTKKSNRELLHHHPDVSVFIESIRSHLAGTETGTYEQIDAVQAFSRKNVTSLDYMYTKALLLD